MTAQKMAGLLGGSIAGAQAALGIAPVYPALLPKWRAALAKVVSGTANARLLYIGDSTGFGAFSNNGADAGDLTANSVTAALKTMFSRAGMAVSENSFTGGGVIGYENRAANDGRIAISSGWAADVGGAIGGCFLKTSSTGRLSFTPRTNCDTFKVWYVRTSGGGTFSIDLNGGTTTNLNGNNAANDIQSGTITGTLGANTLNLNYVSGGICYLAGIECWDSTKKQVIIQNAGWPTSKAGDWVATSANAFAAVNALGNFAGDLTVICLGINDWLAGTSPASFAANLQTLVTNAKTYGDVVLVSPAPTSIGTTAKATQDAIVAQVQALAVANNVPFVDVYSRFVSYEVSNPNGLYGHVAHPNQNGYADIAQGIFHAIGNP